MRVANPLQGQGKQLAAGTGRPVLALYPSVLGRQGHHRRAVEAARRQPRAVGALNAVSALDAVVGLHWHALI